MANETVITIIGNITSDPELRFTPSGTAVANFSIASTPRSFDRSVNEWKDGETLFMRCSCWRDTAENVAESLRRGYRVIASGRLKQRSYETTEGEKRTVVEMEVDEIGPSLRFVTATLHRTQRQQGVPGEPAHGADDPWATPQGQQAQPWGQPTQGPPPQQAPGLPPEQPPQQGLRAVPVEDPPVYSDPPF